jgi:3-dehydroquinate dehydratase-2
MNIFIINGPNLNLLGMREPEVYGKETYQDLLRHLQEHAKKRGCAVDIRQTNHEGTIIDWIQDNWSKVDGIILNPGALTHYSYALRDCVKAVPVPVVEVHLSDISVREPFRSVSVLEGVCLDQIKGKGVSGYVEAMDLLLKGKESQ